MTAEWYSHLTVNLLDNWILSMVSLYVHIAPLWVFCNKWIDHILPNKVFEQQAC